MRVEYINSFYRAIRGVFKLMLDVETQLGKPELGSRVDEAQNLGILLNITGDLSGFVYFIFPNQVVLKIVNILTGMEIEVMDTFTISAISEIVNIISGNAVSHFFKEGKTCDITPPKLYTKELNEAFDKNSEIINLPISSEIGRFYMNITIY